MDNFLDSNQYKQVENKTMDVYMSINRLKEELQSNPEACLPINGLMSEVADDFRKLMLLHIQTVCPQIKKRLNEIAKEIK